MQRTCDRIKKHLMAFFSKMISHDQTSADLHASGFADSRLPWKDLRSNVTYLCYVQRKPENVASYGHAFCDTCVRIYGTQSTSIEHQYMLTCIICNGGTLTVGLQPPTHGIRILSIDGGGTRGVIPLKYLAMLQETVGDSCPVTSLFDLRFSTSSGKEDKINRLRLLTTFWQGV